MTKGKVNSLGWVTSPFWCFLLCWIVLVVWTPDHLLVVGGTTSTSTTARLDLSYLHRCGETDMANAIRGTLEEQQQTRSKFKSNCDSETAKTIVDIDLTASLIGKNLSEILSSLQNNNNDDNENENENESVPVKLNARRNQLSHAQATALVEFVLQNGPTNETTKTTTEEKLLKETQEDAETKAVDPESTAKDATSAETITNGDSKDTETTPSETTTAEITPETDTTTTTRIRPAFVSIESLDLGWNNFGSSNTNNNKSGVRALNGALKRLLADTERCPPFLRLDVCGFGPQSCRDLAKGIVERYKTKSTTTTTTTKDSIPPLSLNLACNQGIGDVGVAALAAAIRTVSAPKNQEPKKRRRKKKAKQEEESKPDDEKESTPEESKEPITILERLDLSGCGIGDAGAEALAIALKNNPLCVKHLDLSNNQISDQGAEALAKALGSCEIDTSKNNSAGFVETLDLSHNPKLGDAGAKSLAQAFERDGISKLILRSCNVRADGAASFGTTLKVLGCRKNADADAAAFPRVRVIDLSGNPLGILSKAKKSGNKYSATALRSKATDTANAYMNIIGKSLQKGLNSINGGVDSLESYSDDEEGLEAGEEEDESRKKCGALSLAEAFIRDGNEEKKTSVESHPSISIELGFRHCSFDTRAAEALAAVLVEAKEEYPNMKVSMDMTMNHVLEDDIIAALHGEDGYDDQLADMAEVYLDALEVMREAKQRALEASRMAAARARAQAERESAWAAPPPLSYSDDDWEEEDEDDWGYERNREDDEEEDYSEEDW